MVRKEHVLSEKNLWNTIAYLKLDTLEEFEKNNYTCIVEPSKQLVKDKMLSKKTIRIKVIGSLSYKNVVCICFI